MATKKQTIVFVIAWAVMMTTCFVYLTNRFTSSLFEGKNAPLLFLMLLATLGMIKVVLRCCTKQRAKG